MKKPKLSYRPIGKSGPLTLYWQDGPYGDAVECKKGQGVAWISPKSELLGVEFDDVDRDSDHQLLITTTETRIEVWVINEKVRVKTYLPKSATTIK